MAAATAIAATGVLISATSAGMSFSQAAKARKQGEKAQKASKELMKEAERKAEVEFMQKLNVPLDAYGREERQIIQSQQQNIQGLQEGDSRNLAAGIGIVGAGATESAENSRIAFGKELFDLQKMQVQEQSDINQDLKDMKVGAAADQQQISRDSEEASAAAMQQGVASVGQAVQGAAAAIPLFPQGAADKRINNIADGLDQSKLSTSVVNPNADAALYAKYSTKGDNYDMNKAALYQDINTTPLGRNQVIERLGSRFTKDQLRGYKKTGIYDQNFYDILNRIDN